MEIYTDDGAQNVESMFTEQPKYYYLSIELIFNRKQKLDLSPNQIKMATTNIIKKIFGEFSAGSDVDILHIKPDNSNVIIRCHDSFYMKLHSCLTIVKSLDTEECYWRVLKASPCLLSLSADSSFFVHGSQLTLSCEPYLEEKPPTTNPLSYGCKKQFKYKEMWQGEQL